MAVMAVMAAMGVIAAMAAMGVTAVTGVRPTAPDRRTGTTTRPGRTATTAKNSLPVRGQHGAGELFRLGRICVKKDPCGILSQGSFRFRAGAFRDGLFEPFGSVCLNLSGRSA